MILATTTTTLVNPAAEAIEAITDPAKACGTDPSWVCEWVVDWTGSSRAAGVADWLVAKPLSILGIVVGAWLVARLARWAVSRGVERLAGEPHRDRMQRLRARTPDVLLRSDDWNLRSEARRHTLVAVVRSIVTVLVWFVATVAILDVVGINFGPLLATAGILGIALGFGTQTMIRDFIAGFFVVVEDQFGVGDVVDLGGDAKGTVEKVTLRSTRLRDVAGVVWHVPNGQIQRVGNKSQEWARALLDVVVGYDADLPRVQELVAVVAQDVVGDPAWRDDVLEAPAVWGVEDLAAEGIVIRMVIKTRPAAQFALLRELRERMKAAFDDAGIGFAAAGGPVEVVLRPEPAPTPDPSPTASADGPPPPPAVSSPSDEEGGRRGRT